MEEQEVDHRILTLACAVGEVVGAGRVRAGAVRVLPQVGDQLAVALSARGHRADPLPSNNRKIGLNLRPWAPCGSCRGRGLGAPDTFSLGIGQGSCRGRGLGREVVRRRHGPCYVGVDPGVQLEPSSGAEPPATWTGTGRVASRYLVEGRAPCYVDGDPGGPVVGAGPLRTATPGPGAGPRWGRGSRGVP